MLAGGGVAGSVAECHRSQCTWQRGQRTKPREEGAYAFGETTQGEPGMGSGPDQRGPGSELGCDAV